MASGDLDPIDNFITNIALNPLAKINRKGSNISIAMAPHVRKVTRRLYPTSCSSRAQIQGGIHDISCFIRLDSGTCMNNHISVHLSEVVISYVYFMDVISNTQMLRAT